MAPSHWLFTVHSTFGLKNSLGTTPILRGVTWGSHMAEGSPDVQVRVRVVTCCTNRLCFRRVPLTTQAAGAGVLNSTPLDQASSASSHDDSCSDSCADSPSPDPESGSASGFGGLDLCTLIRRRDSWDAGIELMALKRSGWVLHLGAEGSAQSRF